MREGQSWQVGHGVSGELRSAAIGGPRLREARKLWRRASLLELKTRSTSDRTKSC
jgi:hypothetical protein